MRRREFIAGGSALALWPVVARAHQAGGRLPTVAILGSAPAGWSEWVPALIQRLRELGWIENRTITIEYRWARGRSYADVAAEVARSNVAIIVPLGSPAAIAAKKATTAIPIVFPLASDPVGDGLVASLARPGGNVTGLSNEQPDLAGKRLGLARDIIPTLSRLGYLANVNNPTAKLSVDELRGAARQLAIEIVPVDIRRPEDVAPGINGLKGRVQALYVVGDPLTADNQVQINELALAARLPTIHNTKGYVASGGFFSYGPDFSDLFRRAAEYVDKILKGAKPADLPVELPRRIEFVLNLKTAKSLGIDIPPNVLARADEVIE